MKRGKALKLLKGGRSGVDEWNSLRKSGEDTPDLSKADLSDTDLGGVNFDDIELIGCNLRGANLSYADLRRAQLNGAELHGTDFIGVTLDGADFSGASCGYTVFANVDFSAVNGLDSIQVEGPCTIGADTLFLSKGTIPEKFLRDCGVPEYLIENQKALIGSMEPIQFYSCFISYSSKDHEFAQLLYSKMRGHGLRVWFAHESARAGKKLRTQIEEAIRTHDKLLVVISRNSLKSKWVKREILMARKAERAGGLRKLFPIRIVGFKSVKEWERFISKSTKNLGVDIGAYFVPDFSGWKDHNSFETAWARLLKDLRAEDSTGPGNSAPHTSRR